MRLSRKGLSPLSTILVFSFVLYSLAACTGNVTSPTPTPAAASADFSWLRIIYPSGWRETSPGHYEGVDGYAWLELRESSGAGPGAVCMSEANRDKPQAYGAYPEIRDIELAGHSACLILPSAGQPAGRRQESLYLLWLPASIRANTLLALHADREHILAISESIGFTRPLPTQPPSVCDFSIAGQAPHTSQQSGLSFDEYPIARGEDCSPLQQPEDFYQRIVSGAAADRAEAVRLKQFQSERLNRLNARLAPFSFQVETYQQNNKPLFRVLRHGTVVRAELSWVGPVSLSGNGQVFFMPVVDSYNGATYLIRPDGMHDQDEVNLLAFDLVFPVYAGPDRISLAYEYARIPRAIGSPALLQVLKNDQVIDTLSVSGATPASGPVRGLWSWQNHWILELPGLVLEDGAMLNDRLGYPEMFTWRLLKDRPFFFYRKANLVHAVYDGQTLPNPYDEVLADPQWTRNVLVQLRAYESGLVFFARRGDTWYYVVLEAS